MKAKFDYENEIQGGYHNDDEPIGWVMITCLTVLGIFTTIAILDLVLGWGVRLSDWLAGWF